MDDENRKVIRGLAMITQVGISMMTPIFLCAAIGWWLDRQFHTQCWFIIMLVLGVGAAFRNMYVVTLSFYSKDMKKEHEKLQYIQDLKQQGQKGAQEATGDGFEAELEKETGGYAQKRRKRLASMQKQYEPDAGQAEDAPDETDR